MSINLKNIKIGNKFPCYIIAEAGVNHNGDLNKAFEMVKVAANAGVDAIKFQTYKTENLVSQNAKMADYQKENTSSFQSQYDLLKSLELPESAFSEILKLCKSLGIEFISTPFDEESVELLNDLNVSLFKISSGEITNLPFIEYIAKKGKPIILSTGMSTLLETEDAVNAVLSTGNNKLVILHCVSCYPANPKDINLKTLFHLSSRFDFPIGFSDHTLGINISLAAVAMGACVIEKHFTLDNTLSGPDHKASLEPKELFAMVKGIREVESSLGNLEKKPVQTEIEISKLVRKSIFSTKKILDGTIITKDMLTAKRPGTGISPAKMCQIIGKTANQNISANTMLSWESLNKS